jgi:hypothetical protein
MVFALAASEGTVRAVEQQRRARTKCQKMSKGKASEEFAAYDMWCGRACRGSFACVGEENEGTYEELLKLSHGIKAAFQSEKMTHMEENRVKEEVIKATRSMNPCVDIDVSHWRWKGAEGAA